MNLPAHVLFALADTSGISRSDRFPADLARVEPITTVHLTWDGFDTMMWTNKMAATDVERSDKQTGWCIFSKRKST